MRFNGTGRTKVYHIFININARRCSCASEDLAKPVNQKPDPREKG